MHDGIQDPFDTLTELSLPGGRAARYFRLDSLQDQGIADVTRLPRSIRVLLESVLRNVNGREVTREDVVRLAKYDPANPARIDVPFMPARVLLQDFTGVPCVVDLAAMRAAMLRLGGDPARINPRIPVDLVIDHSVQVDAFGSPDALRINADLEFARNRERYEFLAWGSRAFTNFRVVPPASGICHQVNLESLGQAVRADDRGDWDLLYPDSCVGTDSHTPMINGLGVVGWGVGGIEAEAVMLGQPLYMLAPRVVGFRLTNALREGVTATDLVLEITRMLRRKGVVEQFVEFFGPGVANLGVPDRATLANMSPEGGSTIGFFPVDARTLDYLRATGRDALIPRVEVYSRAQGLWADSGPEPMFADVLELDLSTVVPSLAGPKRPQDRVTLDAMQTAWREGLTTPIDRRGFGLDPDALERVADVVFPDGTRESIGHGAVVLAAITSCTNTSNPSVMMAAGLLARNARARGLGRKPWVKTSLAPGSTVVTGYLDRAGLLEPLEELGFAVVGYGCTTCIGNSGPLPGPVSEAVGEGGLVAAAVLSGNRNFEGRIHPEVKASYLASPPLVVAYALAGTVDIDLRRDPLGIDPEERPVFLRDVWPTGDEVAEFARLALDPALFAERYRGIERSNPEWNAIPIRGGDLYAFDPDSTYIQEPPFLASIVSVPESPRPIQDARVLVMLGDSITTDHISPAGAISASSSAGAYLVERGVTPREFNSYGARRGNDRVMTRGTFANIRLRNMLAGGREGGFTALLPGGEVMSIFDAAQRYQAAGTPTIVLAGRDYGMGSSRDWAAKGTLLLGVRVVIARSFERIHRSNLVGMGVLPLQFLDGQDALSLGLTGREVYDIGVEADPAPGDVLVVRATADDGTVREFTAICRLDSEVERGYYRHGGILPAVLRGFLGAERAGG